jgi:hypothetical protein
VLARELAGRFERHQHRLIARRLALESEQPLAELEVEALRGFGMQQFGNPFRDCRPLRNSVESATRQRVLRGGPLLDLGRIVFFEPAIRIDDGDVMKGVRYRNLRRRGVRDRAGGSVSGQRGSQRNHGCNEDRTDRHGEWR